MGIIGIILLLIKIITNIKFIHSDNSLSSLTDSIAENKSDDLLKSNAYILAEEGYLLTRKYLSLLFQTIVLMA